jgi:predicted peroxiredoxin
VYLNLDLTLEQAHVPKVEITTKKQKRYKLMAVGHILEESFQAGCKMYSEVQKLINCIWNKEELPEQCKESIIIRFLI